MGATSNKQVPHKMPEQGSRVMQILNPELENKLQPFTDYITEPPPQLLKNSIGDINATVFSTLDYSFRKEVLPVSQNHLGAKIKVTRVNDCSLRVTKVFPNSPCQRLGITASEYIVGLVQAQFNNLASFAQALRNLISAQREVFTLAICNQQGLTRLVPVSVTILSQWRSSSQGILGCQLAEGWMHRFKGRPKRGTPLKALSEECKEDEQEEPKMKEEEKQINRIHEMEADEGEEEWQQIERKVGGQSVGQSLEVTFKGLLKNEYLQDASTICRCKIYDKHCERCWMQRDGGYHYFNKKSNRIVTIPANLLLKVSE